MKTDDFNLEKINRAEGTHVLQLDTHSHWLRLINYETVGKYLNTQNLIELMLIRDFDKDVGKAVTVPVSDHFHKLFSDVVSLLSVHADEHIYPSDITILRMDYDHAVVIRNKRIVSRLGVEKIPEWLAELLDVPKVQLLKRDDNDFIQFYKLIYPNYIIG